MIIKLKYCRENETKVAFILFDVIRVIKDNKHELKWRSKDSSIAVRMIRQCKTKITFILIVVSSVMCNLLSPFRNKFNCIAQNGR